MGCLGNIIWFIFGGFISGLGWMIAGCLWCITIVGIPMAIVHSISGILFCVTIIGIPFGLQCFKLAKLSLLPFGSKII